MKKTIAILLMYPTVCFCGIKEQDIIPGLKLRLDNQLQITDKNGVVLPNQIIGATVGKLVSLYRTDGFKYDGQITEIEESAEYLKVYGKFLNVEDANFGFIIAKGGHFAGAIIEKKENKIYVLEFSATHKGFIFIRSFKHDKPSAKNEIEESWSIIEPVV